MADRRNDEFDEFLAIRKPGAHLEEEVVPNDFVIQLGVDIKNYRKFPRVNDNVQYPKASLDIRQDLDKDSGAEFPDYSGAGFERRAARPPSERPRRGGQVDPYGLYGWCADRWSASSRRPRTVGLLRDVAPG